MASNSPDAIPQQTAERYAKFLRTDPKELVARLSPVEQASILAGRNWWETVPVPSIGLPSIKMSDGPNGVRGASQFRTTPSQCIPCATALASTWNVDTLKDVGHFLAAECLAKGSSLLLGPTVNIQRSPLGGRAFESFSEDPNLSGHLAAAYINGLQADGVGACIKHFVCNDQEHERNAVNSDVDERSLREVYLRPFEIAQRLAKPWCYMSSYGRIDRKHCSENSRLLQGILRSEWGFDGMIMSDWFGTYSTSEALNAGLDLEMPGPAEWRGDLVKKALAAQKVLPKTVAQRAQNVIKLAQKAVSNHPEIIERGTEYTNDSPKDRLQNRKFAQEAIVLLKNEEGVLPLKPDTLKKIALIGPNAKARVISGGGSAALTPKYVVTPFEGISAAAAEHGIEVAYEVGCHSHKYLPLMDGSLRVTADVNSEVGYLASFYNDNDCTTGQPGFLETLTLTSTKVRINDNLPDGLDPEHFTLQCTGYFTPDTDGVYNFGLILVGRGRLYVDDELVLDMWEDMKQGTAFYGRGCEEEIAQVSLKAGHTHKIHLHFNSNIPESMREYKGPFLMTAAFQLGYCQKLEPTAAISRAAELAKESDVTIVVVGNNMDWEAEGHDRQSLTLPGLQNELVEALTMSSKSLVVVNQSGSAVAMPWSEKVPAIVQSWFSGCEMGNAMADVLFGKVNPSGKLPITFPKREEDMPSFLNLRSENGTIRYSEGLYVGYKWYQARKIEPAFPFGHGLSYTMFTYRDLSFPEVAPVPIAQDSLVISFWVKNVGPIPGAEVSQVYVKDLESSLHRPGMELKGFSKNLLLPGEEKRVSVTLDRSAFSFYDDRQDQWIIEKGKFEILIGTSCAKIILQGVLCLT